MQLLEALIILVILLVLLPIVRYLSKVIIDDSLDEIHYFKEITKKKKASYVKLNKITKYILYTLYILCTITIALIALTSGIENTNKFILTGFSLGLFILITGILISEIIQRSFKTSIVKDGIEYKQKK